MPAQNRRTSLDEYFRTGGPPLKKEKIEDNVKTESSQSNGGAATETGSATTSIHQALASRWTTTSSNGVANGAFYSVKHESLPKPNGKMLNCLHWFRRDLRLQDNPALSYATFIANQCQTHACAIYIISPEDMKLHDDAPIKIDFWMRNLKCLQQELDKLNIPLVIKTVPKRRDIPQVLLDFCDQHGISELTINHEYEVDEDARDKKVQRLFESKGKHVHGFHEQCVIQPGKLMTQSNKPYTVFTPFKRAWLSLVEVHKISPGQFADLQLAPKLEANDVKVRDSNSSFHTLFTDKSLTTIPDSVPGFEMPADLQKTAHQMYPAGEADAHSRLDNFVRDKVKLYDKKRSLPGEPYTSTLSPHFASGIISSRQCLQAAVKANNGKLSSGSDGIQSWIQEIIWRDFYRHVLVHYPKVCKNQPFRDEGNNIQWATYNEDEENEAFFAWCEGRTGYPIIDAGMRQMNATGWMHNRLRMATAMFLSKDLLINWQRGERYFMQCLIDGDLASNNGGWQWAASTGTDAQRYFRIFNPMLQSEKFDKSGDYIRRWVPELKTIRGPAIHDPYHVLDRKAFEALNYPKPMVDHKFGRDRALQAYKAAMHAGSAKQ
ncbi:hypothetical protein BZG36_00807 [Bifiguratus adelaidae]|uniref:Photolyase/cryptochrome alpha/beta domain-containing protein n=1 Tax=Bifiguratus adelaidae TaxID=1938954 RepID=A0A261Y6M5_9FUNG|nr:hypothetical protein BZG36_00807 [Bifiguratus adelaidae]